WQADDLVLLPRPAEPVPLMIGSTGERMLSIALPHVEWWNTWYTHYGNTVEGFAAVNARVTAAAEHAGRNSGAGGSSAARPLERRVRGDVGVGLDLRHRPDRGVVLDERAAADDDVVAERDALADAGLVADDHAGAELRPGEDDRAGRDHGAVADLDGRELLAR